MNDNRCPDPVNFLWITTDAFNVIWANLRMSINMEHRRDYFIDFEKLEIAQLNWNHEAEKMRQENKELFIKNIN